MRIAILALILAGCAPVPPGYELGGHASWDLDGYASEGDLYACVVEDRSLLVSAGELGRSLTLRLGGPVGDPEWDGEILDGYHVLPLGTEFGDSRLRPLTGCTAHVGTGAGSWIIDLECDNGDASIVVTGCAR